MFEYRSLANTHSTSAPESRPTRLSWRVIRGNEETGAGKSTASGDGRGDSDGAVDSVVEGWQAAMAAAGTTTALDSGEDSLGNPLLPCDGRECKIRIVERLGEIKGSRASVGLELGGGLTGEVDDTELNELGNDELEGLLEQMWMQVMSQVRELARVKSHASEVVALSSSAT